MSLYPSLEDLKVDKVIQAQTAFSANPASAAILSDASAPISQDGSLYPKLYPELSQYMGLSLNEEEICTNMALVPGATSQGQQLVARPSAVNYMVAPITGNDAGIRRAEIKQGIREVILCKDEHGKIGLRLKSIDNGVFVQLVQANSPASLVGLRFGDQVLQINGENCAGWSSDKAHKVLKQAFGEKITMTIRDRPFERTITMHKDSTGHVGFIFKNGKITSIVKDSSAARNGLLTEHNICEINGQNVIGLKDSQVADILSTSGTVVTITIMPAFIFEHIIKRMASSVMKNLMDHAIPEV
ncbi:syntenin-1 isoform X1 [Vombatus ursinus]|uniref:PDZ domain-containing protein n=1 Tax=Vombatus ursinus TaxID=29139 RepID=A0A4X2LYR9_VOMUR|nr:syntenin-1 isoform X1 [Vombatus ursinus]XP_027733125.1 syntenin-1 isoform X1 [Vombatus ursinus]XP_027733129.1 syntenin-1 isoform X1 [Vombatus ursinus]XP_027733130.1 syntenin-1 isoform X1 [Vombatus ursinus]